ncbi:uncharacterized protein IUM83_04852 [Phytophthora cinnamomi]|uniref:uncharacterized protein n=1 Tax=Phytophthora cinnamomi TaxID=4785 RepID=UPI00355A2712|nr:hypothetical protein IUM83_04852 [Phytophthora cinnamomi]
MVQVSQPAISPSNNQFSSSSAAIEQFRIRHRQLCRGQQQQQLKQQRYAESLEVEEGRARKISANWRQKQKQEQAQSRYGYEDGNWPKAAGTEMHIGFNAFDFSSCPEAFYDLEEQEDNQAASCKGSQQPQQHGATLGALTSASSWGLQSFRHPGGIIRSTPFDLQATRNAPDHHANNDERRRAL